MRKWIACRRTLFTALSAAISVAAMPDPALADAGHDHGAMSAQPKEDGHAVGHDHGHAIGALGEPGKASAANRKIEIRLDDNRFEPKTIHVRAGETIRFVLTNRGQFLHEFNIGTAAMHAEHQKEMAVMMELGMLTPTGINHQMMNMDHAKLGTKPMKHDEPNTALVEPGKTKELVWKFTRAGQLEFACNIPGHYESGMVGKLEVHP